MSVGNHSALSCKQVDECAGALIRAASRAEEDLAPLLPARKRAYLFTCLGFAAARTIMWLLPEIKVGHNLPSMLPVMVKGKTMLQACTPLCCSLSGNQILWQRELCDQEAAAGSNGVCLCRA